MYTLVDLLGVVVLVMSVFFIAAGMEVMHTEY